MDISFPAPIAPSHKAIHLQQNEDKFSYNQSTPKLGVAAHAGHFSTQEAETEGLLPVPGQHGLPNEFPTSLDDAHLDSNTSVEHDF